MSLRRYAERHDNVLQILSSFVKQHLKPSYALTADLSDEPYAFPQHITPTNLRPDLVWWSEQQKVLWILELTISFKIMMENAHQTKTAKYMDLVEEVRLGGYRAECIAFEVGSRGLLIESELIQLRDALSAPGKDLTELAGSLSRSAILGSFKIWCSRNRRSE